MKNFWKKNEGRFWNQIPGVIFERNMDKYWKKPMEAFLEVPLTKICKEILNFAKLVSVVFSE